MSQVLKCKPNVPEEIALKFPDGINVSGQYGNQVLYTLADNRRLYLPPIVAEKIKDLKVVPEERFSLCKRTEPGNLVQWEVKRVDPPANEPELVAPAHSQAATVSPSQNTQHSNGNRQEKLTQLGNLLVNGIPETKAELMTELGLVLKNAGQDEPPPPDPDDPGYGSNGTSHPSNPTPKQQAPAADCAPFYLERSCLLIDVVAAAHKYAVETYNGTFTKEDVRSLVLSVFIQNGKSTGVL